LINTTAKYSLSTVEYFLSASVKAGFEYWTIDSCLSEYMSYTTALVSHDDTSVCWQNSFEGSGNLSTGSFNNSFLRISRASIAIGGGGSTLPDLF